MVITVRPFEQMSLRALRAELAMAARALGRAPHCPFAQDWRDEIAGWVCRREREQLGRAA
jgi:hypothetical protein